jgi:uncharacterized protein (DUF58 family)
VASTRTVVKLAVALVLAGAAFDSPSLYVPGIALALLWGGSLAWVRLAVQGTRIERERGPATVVEGELYPLRIRIRRGTVPPRGELADPLLESPLRVHPFVRERVRQVSVPVRFARRGRRRLDPARLIVRDPLGLRSQEVRSRDGGEVLVLPRIEPVLAATDGGGAASGGMPEELGEGAGGSGLDPRPIDFEVDGLRPYRQGSPASRIHWPAVARTGDLLERRLVAGAESSPLVVLDAARPDDEESLDRAVRAAASLCVHVARTAGGCALLLPGEARPLQIDSGLRAWPEAHARLALVTSRDGAPATAGASRAEAVFWVTARGGERPGRRVGALAARVAYLVTPGPIPGRRSDFTVAGCYGHVLAARGRPRVARGRAAA